jgi:hypothetical protein
MTTAQPAACAGIAAIFLPRFVHALDALERILERAGTHARAQGYDPAVLFGARLYPDMFALSRQVQIVCDLVKGAVTRLAGQEVPRHEDTETTLEELVARIGRVRALVQAARPDSFAGAETREIVLNLRGNEVRFTGQDYLLAFVLPNLYFHATTTYAILRHNGVVLGKRDFLDPLERTAA